MDDNFLLKKIYIWGTGRNAESFMERFRIFYESEVDYFQQLWKRSIVAFIDNDKRKEGGCFVGKPIISFEEACGSGMDFCLITVQDSQKIIETLIVFRTKASVN